MLFNLILVIVTIMFFLYKNDKIMEKLANELQVSPHSIDHIMLRIITYILLVLSSFPLFIIVLALIISMNIIGIDTLLHGFLIAFLTIVLTVSFYYAKKSIPLFLYWIESLLPLFVLKDKEKKKEIIIRNGGIISLFVGVISFVSFVNIFLLSFFNLLFVTVYSVLVLDQSPQGILTIPVTVFFIMVLLYSKVDIKKEVLRISQGMSEKKD